MTLRLVQMVPETSPASRRPAVICNAFVFTVSAGLHILWEPISSASSRPAVQLCGRPAPAPALLPAGADGGRNPSPAARRPVARLVFISLGTNQLLRLIAAAVLAGLPFNFAAGRSPPQRFSRLGLMDAGILLRQQEGLSPDRSSSTWGQISCSG